jgi:hypothetical protein
MINGVKAGSKVIKFLGFEKLVLTENQILLKK